MKKAIALSALLRRWQSGILLMLTVGLVTTPVMALLSEKAGQIQGQAPVVTGSVEVLFPDGETVLTDNAILALNQIPNQFRVSSSTAGLVLQDADGDTGLAASVDIEHAILSWKYNGTALTSAQLAAPFNVNFSGQTVTLDVSVPVIASSTTGLPTTAEPRLLTSSYTLTVAPELFTGISVNADVGNSRYGHTFGMTEGFPSTGFTGARFKLNVYYSHPNSYTWDSGGSSWVTVDNGGTVTFTEKGNSTPVTITATPKGGGTPLTYTFSVKNWFINNGNTSMNWSDAANWCTTQGGSLPTRVELGWKTRGVGGLWSEWGPVGYYGLNLANTWTSDQDVNGLTYYVDLRDGYSNHYAPSTNLYVACRQDL